MVLDFNMMLKETDIFTQLKPDLRYRLIGEIFGDIHGNEMKNSKNLETEANKS